MAGRVTGGARTQLGPPPETTPQLTKGSAHGRKLPAPQPQSPTKPTARAGPNAVTGRHLSSGSELQGRKGDKIF